MKTKRYKPELDKLYYITMILTMIVVLTPVIICGLHTPTTLYITIPIFLFTAYFFITTLFGYAELRESSLYIKYGFIMSCEIPYNKIRAIQKERKFYADGMVSIKTSLNHINVKYNTFDITTISIEDGDEFIRELNKKCEGRLI